MKFRTSSLSTAVIIFGALAISSHPAAQNVNSEIVDAPGADTTAVSGNGAFASDVKEAGAIAHVYGVLNACDSSKAMD